MRTFLMLALASMVAVSCSAPADRDLATLSVDAADAEQTQVGEAGDHAVGDLARFDGCDELADWYRREALARVGPFGLFGPGAEDSPVSNGEGTVRLLREDAARAATSRDADDAGFGGFVVVVGERIVTLGRGALSVTYGAPAGELKSAGSLQMGAVEEAAPVGLFAAAGGVFVVEQILPPLLFPGEDFTRAPGPWSVRVTEFRFNPPGSFGLVQRGVLHVEGVFIEGVAVDDVLRLVVSTPPPQLGWDAPNSADEVPVAVAANRALIEAAEPGDWLPEVDVLGADDDGTDVPVDCEDVFRPDVFSGFDVTSLVTVDAVAGLESVSFTGVAASAAATELTEEAFALATGRWVEIDGRGTGVWGPSPEATTLHHFDLGSAPMYLGSGERPGRVVAGDSLSVDGQLLRVWTTGYGVVGSSLWVLEPSAGRLDEVGSADGLGSAQGLSAVTVAGDTGFGFSAAAPGQVYVLDLAEPSDPVVSGVFDVSSDSGRLYPVSPGHVLWVGADSDLEHRGFGLRVALFAVDGPSGPVEVASWSYPGATSPVEYDPSTLHWVDGAELVVFPVAAMGETPEQVFSGGGSLVRCWSTVGTADGVLVRSVVVGDVLYTFSGESLQSNDLTSVGLDIIDSVAVS